MSPTYPPDPPPSLLSPFSLGASFFHTYTYAYTYFELGPVPAVTA